MKRLLLTLLSLVVVVGAGAQRSNVGSISLKKPIENNKTEGNKTFFMPPNLNIVGEPEFRDADGNLAIDAGERCSISMTVENIGLGPAVGLVAVIQGTGSMNGIIIQNDNIEDIPVGVSRTIVFPITATMQTEDGHVTFDCAVTEPQGFGTEPYTLTLSTNAFRAPNIKMADSKATSTKSVTLKRKDPFCFQVLITNDSAGQAEDVTVDLSLPPGVFLFGGNAIHEEVAAMAPGESCLMSYDLMIAQTYDKEEVPIQVNLGEKYHKYATDGYTILHLDESIGSNRITIDPIKAQFTGPKVQRLNSIVDRNIPLSKSNNENTFVLIIANSEYKYENAISTASNDGLIMAKYCHATLGIPEAQIRLGQNLTKTEMESELKRFANIMKVEKNNKDRKFMVFYFGHGMTDPQSFTPFLIPVDGSSRDLVTNGISRNSITHLLAEASYGAPVMLFLESCFSGARPDNKTLSFARDASAARITPTTNRPEGNIVIVSASQGTQAALAYNEEFHNVFTFCFLKALQETRGEGVITLGPIFDKASEDTYRTAMQQLDIEQEPSVTVGIGVKDDWRTWVLN